jgi:hypothetical protein
VISALIPVLVPALTSVIVVVITAVGQWINSRNDRSLANQELDALKKLDPETEAAQELTEVIQFRIAKWYARIAESRRALRDATIWSAVSGTFLVFGALYASVTGDWSSAVFPFIIGFLLLLYTIRRATDYLRALREEQKAASARASGDKEQQAASG